VDPQLLLAELTEQKRSAFRKVQPWNAFLREEAKGLKVNKETITPLVQKYHETTEEERKGYVKRMTHSMDKGEVDRSIKKSFKQIDASMENLLKFGIESVFVAGASPQVKYALKGTKLIVLGGNTF
ncbi:hypothetical protein, partial, partial [Absidia glauca]